ncbi:Quinoprotein alcohol dehydrogenase-like protein [Gracilaria domingensis]|nr:Quinoprotein alcohol dehydrogenase-like protein [Gracilaria domingensis]
MFLSTVMKITVLELCLLLTVVAEALPHSKSSGRSWIKSYEELKDQTWLSISHGGRDGGLYCAGRLRYAHNSKIPCFSTAKMETEEENTNDHVNGVICKLDSRKGRKIWCARTCEAGIPVLSVVASGKDIVYTAGGTNSENTVLFGVEKKTGRQVMYVLIQGKVAKMDDNLDGVYVCGRGTDEDGKPGMMIARIAEAGNLQWLRILRDGGLENCLSISAMKKGFSVFVIGIMRSSSDKFRLSVMKLKRATGEVEWTTKLAENHYVPTSGDVIAKKGVYVAALKSDSKSERAQVVIHKLGQGSGITLWSKSGKDADVVYESGFRGEHDFVYASCNNSGVRISFVASSSTNSLLGDVERKNEIWIQQQHPVMSEAVDTTLGIDQAVILWRTNQGGNMIQKVSFNRVREAESEAGVAITRVKTKLKMALPTAREQSLTAGICDIVGDAIRGRARIANGLLMAGGKVTKYEAEMVIRKVLEDRDNNGRSYVERNLDLGKRSVLLEGKLTTIDARHYEGRSTQRPHRSATIGTLAGPVEAGGQKSVVAEATKASWWTWWKGLILTIGVVGVGVVVWLVLRRF